MKPAIFMDDFERTEWDDQYFAATGRLLTFATRFESNCKTLTVLLELKATAAFDSEKELNALAAKLRSPPLFAHINAFGLDSTGLDTVLHNARNARNELAHDFAAGLEDGVRNNKVAVQITAELRRLSLAIATADILISLALSALTHEPIPRADFIDQYAERVADWVCNLDS